MSGGHCWRPRRCGRCCRGSIGAGRTEPARCDGPGLSAPGLVAPRAARCGPGGAIEPDAEPAEPGVEIVLDPGPRLLTDHRARPSSGLGPRNSASLGPPGMRPAPPPVRVGPATPLLLCCARDGAATPEYPPASASRCRGSRSWAGHTEPERGAGEPG